MQNGDKSKDICAEKEDHGSQGEFFYNYRCTFFLFENIIWTQNDQKSIFTLSNYIMNYEKIIPLSTIDRQSVVVTWSKYLNIYSSSSILIIHLEQQSIFPKH